MDTITFMITMMSYSLLLYCCRLEDYDKLYGPLITDPETVYKIALPSPQHFQDVNSSSPMPSLNSEEMEMFCRLTERENITTSRNMYDEYFLMSCRLAEENGDYYVTGMVSSEMRKTIVYNVVVKLKNHLILEAQCECAAGMGPYAQCKHILVVICGIIDMHQNKSIKLKGSVTSSLQTFHQPRKLHTGEPVKAEELALKVKDTKYKEIISFDPRPIVETPEDFTKTFKNAVANFCGQSYQSNVMPIAQIIKPADKQSIYADHDYLQLTQEQEFFQQRNLNEEERQALEEKTRIDHKLWKKERLTRMHSSNFGMICKATSGQKKIAASLVIASDLSTPAIKHGVKYEDEAVRKFEEIMQLLTERCGVIVHSTLQFLASTPDRLVGSDSVLEIKCPYNAKEKNISPETVPYLYLCEKEGCFKLNKEHNYYYQVQGQLLCTGRQKAYFCVYTITDFKMIVIKKDDHFIRTMVQKLTNFYNLHFENVLLQRYLYNKK